MLPTSQTGRKVFRNISNGHNGGRVELAIIGHVYDVSSGEYYQKGGGYDFFAGRDGSRAFITGASAPSRCCSYRRLTPRRAQEFNDKGLTLSLIHI